MTYICWSALYEGATDEAYYEILIPRLMEDIALRRGNRNITIPTKAAVLLGEHGRGVDDVAIEARASQEAFHIIFIHADTGGRGLEQNLDHHSVAYCQRLNSLFAFSTDRCVTITPRHETEAWILADPYAIASALGYQRSPDTIELPKNAVEAERLVDPKAELNRCVNLATGNRRRTPVARLIPLISRNQSLNALRKSKSFRDFESKLVTAMISLGCID
ncbi:DUF4276 family protein [Parasphingorhabdus sp.]|uniref:DUF4276 family protein n=1 Tax=Parasphingorhabdus sp. TaxID=2709688 RepID=UPI0030014403